MVVEPENARRPPSTGVAASSCGRRPARADPAARVARGHLCEASRVRETAEQEAAQEGRPSRPSWRTLGEDGPPPARFPRRARPDPGLLRARRRVRCAQGRDPARRLPRSRQVLRDRHQREPPRGRLRARASSELGKNFRATTSARPTASTATSASSSTSRSQSLFTHVTLNDIRLCMHLVAAAMRPGTFLRDVLRGSARAPAPRHSRARDRAKEQAAAQRPKSFWYYTADLEWAAGFSPWEFRYIGGWNHPGNQRMIELTRALALAPARPVSTILRASGARTGSEREL